MCGGEEKKGYLGGGNHTHSPLLDCRLSSGPTDNYNLVIVGGKWLVKNRKHRGKERCGEARRGARGGEQGEAAEGKKREGRREGRADRGQGQKVGGMGGRKYPNESVERAMMTAREGTPPAYASCL